MSNKLTLKGVFCHCSNSRLLSRNLVINGAFKIIDVSRLCVPHGVWSRQYQTYDEDLEWLDQSPAAWLGM